MSELRDINTILKNLDADQCILYFRDPYDDATSCGHEIAFPKDMISYVERMAKKYKMYMGEDNHNIRHLYPSDRLFNRNLAIIRNLKIQKIKENRIEPSLGLVFLKHGKRVIEVYTHIDDPSIININGHSYYEIINDKDSFRRMVRYIDYVVFKSLTIEQIKARYHLK
jgi:hypothetical protein